MPLGQMIDMHDFRGKPFQVEAALRVVVGDWVGYILGYSHIRRGSFSVWFPDEGESFSTTLGEIDSMTDDARSWIAGILAGNEPDIWEYLGVDRFYDPTEAEYLRWQNFTARFRQTGVYPFDLNRRPTRAIEATDDELAEIRVRPWRPWSKAGERVWVPSGDTWVEADPQPDLVDGQMPGTICAEHDTQN